MLLLPFPHVVVERTDHGTVSLGVVSSHSPFFLDRIDDPGCRPEVVVLKVDEKLDYLITLNRI
jgi:hypothetical protein